MKQEERKQKIDTIMSEIKKGRLSDRGIPVHLWLAAENGKPGEPDFEEWLVCCTECVDDYYIMTGKKDTDSGFAQFVRKYGRRERNNNKKND